MLAKRIIPCLDVTGGRVVKGVNFVELRDAGDPVEIAARYNEQGADELTFLDITATSDARDADPAHHRGGGVAGLHPAHGRRRRAQRSPTCAGCSTPAPTRSASTRPRSPNPQVIRDASDKYGAQCIVVAIDAKRRGAGDGAAGWDVYTHGGRTNTGLDAVDWARAMAARGAGEILLTSMDRDGTQSGFDLELTRAVADAVPVPVIASGGVGTLEHLSDGIRIGGADAVLAASIFHYGEYTVREAKALMARAASPCGL